MSGLPQTACRSGLDSLRNSGFTPLCGERVAVLANHAAMDGSGLHLLELLCASGECSVLRLFAPEHGFRGTLQNMAAVRDEIIEGLPAISLYGPLECDRRPDPAMISDIDTLVVDLPDIGARYYTYAQTMLYCMRAAAKSGCRVLVLDRPNPISGSIIEGCGLEPDCRSFCGAVPVPQRHGLTLGELALLMNTGFGRGRQAVQPVGCRLEIAPVTGWCREQYFDETGLPWIAPSSNLRTLDAAIVYPGACLFEAANISEGRGTEAPFQLLGAPFICGRQWAEAAACAMPGLEGGELLPEVFTPSCGEYAGRQCGGVRLIAADRRRFRPFRWAIALLAAARRLYPAAFCWRRGSSSDRRMPIDLFYGSARLRETIDENRSLEQLERSISEYEQWFSEARADFLRY